MWSGRVTGPPRTLNTVLATHLSVVIAVGDPGFPEWLSSGGSLAVLIGVVGLFLSGKITTAKDVEERLEQHRHTCDAELLAASTRIELLSNHLADVTQDRDKWREAAEEANRALAMAESTTEKALESGRMATALLAALQTALERGYPKGESSIRGTGDGAPT